MQPLSLRPARDGRAVLSRPALFAACVLHGVLMLGLLAWLARTHATGFLCVSS